jgi:Flp pilus assembly protein TadD
MALVVRTRSQLFVWRDTVTLYQHTVEVTQNNWWMHLQLGRQLAWFGRHDEALEHFQRAAMINRNDVEVLSELGIAFLRRGDVQPALAVYEQLLLVEPDNVPALNNLAWFAAAHPDPAFRNASRAVTLAQRACELTAHKDPGNLDTLAAAYAEAGRFDQAVSTAQAAHDLAFRTGDHALAATIREHMEHYRRGQPWRDHSIAAAPSR